MLNVARYDIDGLREALLGGDIARLARTLDGLMHEGEAPPLVLWAMSEEIRALAVIRSGMDAGKPTYVLLKEAKVWVARNTGLPDTPANTILIDPTNDHWTRSLWPWVGTAGGQTGA